MSSKSTRPDKSTTGKKIPKETPSLIKPLPADHPIFKRGFAIGVTRSIPSLPNTRETDSPGTKPNSTPTREGSGFSIPEASPDHPIYKRGFAIGVMRSTPSSKSTQAPTSPDTKQNSRPTQETSSTSAQTDSQSDSDLGNSRGRRPA